MPDNEYDALFTSSPPARPRGSRNYDDIITRHAQRTGLDPELVRAVVHQESGGNPRAVSPKGAQGIGQLMPATAKRFGVTDPFDPEQNIRGATDYLRFLNDRFKGNRDLVLAGYNAGEGAVDKFGGIPPYRETQNYIRSINARLDYVQSINARQQSQPTNTDPYAALFDSPAKQLAPAPQPPRPPRPRRIPPSFNRPPAFGPPPDAATTDAIRQGIADAERRVEAPLIRQAIDDYERTRSQTSNLGELRQIDDPETQRHLRVQREVAAANPIGSRLRPRAAERETLRRVTEEREDEAKRVRDEPRLAELTEQYRRQIRSAAALSTGFSQGSPQWTQEVVSKVGAGLAQLGAAATRPFSTDRADAINLHAQALQRAAEEEGIDRNRVSKALQNIVAGTITSVPELAAIRAGVRAPVAFGAGGAARSYGRDERPRQVLEAGAHGAATGLIFEAPAALGITNPLARVGTVGAGTGALELATGQPLDVALETGATNALMAGIGEVGRPRARPAPERIVEVEGRSTIPGYEAETAVRAQREARVRPPLTPREVEQLQARPASPTEPSRRVPTVDEVPLPRRDPVPVSPLETAITSRATRQERITQLEGELAQWQRAGGRSRRGTQRIRQIQREIDGLRQSLQAEDTAAATQLAQERSAAVESTRYSPTPRFDEWVENRTGQRVAQVPESELTQLREQYRQEFANAPTPPLQREMPPLETPPVHHSLRQPRRQRGQGKGQFKRGKPASVEEETIRPPLSPPVSPETAKPGVVAPATASLPRDRRSAARMKETDWLELTPEEQQRMRSELETSQRATEPPKPAQTDILSETSRQPPTTASEPLTRRLSQIVDKQGRPLTVYHQTLKEAEPTIRERGFDLSLARARRTDEGVPDGVFFKPTNENIFAGSKPEDFAQLAANLHVESPLKVRTREELVKWARTRDREYVRLQNEVAAYDTPRRIKLMEDMQATDPQVKQRAEAEYQTLVDKATAARARLTETIKQAGYDGVVIERDVGGPKETKTFVVLDPKQVKLLDQEPSTTSARRAQMTADRTELDLPELPAPQRKAWQETLDQAKQRGTANASTLAEQVLNKPRALSDVETAQLVLRAQEIKNQLATLRQEIVNDPTPERIAQSDALQEEFNRLTQATKASGTEKGRTLAAQKLTINREYDLTSLIQRATEAKGRKLTPEETTRYEQMAQRIAELESQVSTKAVQSTTDTIQREIDRISRQRKRAETKQLLDEEFAQLKQQFQQARAEARKVQGSGLAGLDPEGTITPLIARMAKNRIKAGVKSAEALVSEIYETVKAHGWTRDDVAHVVRSTITQSDDVLSRWDKRRQGQLIKQQEELNRRLEQRDFTKPAPRQPPIYNRETQRLAEQVQSLKNKFELEMQHEQPGHWWRTLSSLRKSWMLSGLSTQAKNIGGTGGYQVFEELARLPAAIADAAVAPFTGRRTLTTSPAQMLDAVLHARRVGLPEAGQILRRGATPEQLERHQFSEIDTGIKVIDFASNLVFRFMSASDRVFYQYSYKRNLNDRAMVQAKNEGAGRERARELTENPPEELNAAAKHDALVATFNNNNKLSDAIKSARARLGPKANFAIDIVMPFDRTPTNVITRVLEASPVGLGQSAYRAAKAIVNKSMTPVEQRQFSQTLGRATVGTAILALGWKLADDAFDIEDNGQVYLNVGGRRYNLNSISPVGNLLAVGAKLRQDYEKGDVTGAAKTIARTPLDQPLLRAGSEVTELLRDPERSATRTGARIASSFVPFGGAVRDVSKALDPEDRRFPDPRSFTQQVQQGIPKLRERLPVSRSKVFSGQTSSSPATKEIQRLNMRLQGAMPGDDEPPPQYERRRQAMNPAVVKELERLVQSPAYARLSDDDKRKQIRALVQSVASAFRPAASTSRRPARPSRRDLRP